MNSRRRILIVGCGYLGSTLGTAWVAAGHHVAGIRRPGGDVSGMRRAGIEPWLADLAIRSDLDRLPDEWDWVVDCAAPSEGGEEAYRRVYREGARNLVDRFRSRPPKAFLFTGSTGVYPQNDGSEVDETASTHGAAPTGRILRETEEVFLRAVGDGFPAVLLRISGIYGPGRNRVDAVLRGDAKMYGDGSRWMNMIHRDDLAGAVVAALERGRPGSLYNVSDGAPCTEREFYGWLGARLGKEVPSAAPDGDTGRRGRALANRRIRIEKIRQDLGWVPRYPDYRAGYEQVLESTRIGSCEQGRE
ncbi:MAG: SDR family oxidoreductase [Verrucomicrobiales bacterium]|nr:SDR family oxidoreductase [Verrucomicrobiales bacterium]